MKASPHQRQEDTSYPAAITIALAIASVAPIAGFLLGWMVFG